MSPRVRVVSPGVVATLKRSTLPCVRAETAAAHAGFAVWPLERPAMRGHVATRHFTKFG